MAPVAFRALKPWLTASLVAGISYYFIRQFVLPPAVLIGWKAAGVGSLAVFAYLHRDVLHSRTIAAIMALGAAGDALIELSIELGALAFLIGHGAATLLYWRLGAARSPFLARLAGGAAVLAIAMLAWWLSHSAAAAVYALGLGAMAVTAWASGLPRATVGFGAILFAASDLLIFARFGVLARSPLPDLLIWPLYYLGQLLICTGAIAALGRRNQASG